MQVLENVDILKSTTIKIYVSNLGAYNAGVLTGEWSTLPVDDIRDIFKRDREKFGNIPGYGKEFFITDYEAPFEIGEYDSISDLNRLAAALQDDGLKDIEDVYNNLDNLENLPERPYDWDDFNEIVKGMNLKPSDIMARTTYGNVNFNDDYIRFDGVANFETLSEWDWQEELNDYSGEIISRYADENGINL